MRVGDLLPDFNLPDQDWNMLSSKSLIGHPVVIYFYPKDDTPGCTKQACAFRDHFVEFQDRGIRVIGISADSPEDHRKFIEKYRLQFTLLSDPSRAIQKAFKVPTNLFGLIPGRVTYIFDHEGKLIHLFNSQLNTERHVEEAMNALFEAS